MNEDLNDYHPTERIVIIGVGGAGNNAVNRMIDENIDCVEFYVMNTDRQALSTSKTPNRIILGEQTTGGLGAGGDPKIGRAAAEESSEEIRSVVKGANLVFIAAGMGGGTGTGAAPVVARIAREENALTIAIVNRPFSFEGQRRISNSVEGLNELKDTVDSIIIISNDKLLMTNGTLPVNEAFAEADRVLTQSVKTVTDLIFTPSLINLDFSDVEKTLKNSGISLIGFGMGTGPNRVRDAATSAINSPLLEASINGARKVICHITLGTKVTLYESQDVVRHITASTGNIPNLIFGITTNPQLSDEILVSIIASDFTEEFDFTRVPTIETPLSPLVPESVDNLENNVESSEEEQSENDDDGGISFIPDYLANKDVD